MSERHTLRPPKGKKRGWHSRWVAIVLEFFALFLFWLALSGRFELRYIIIGAFAAAIVTALTTGIVYANDETGDNQESPLKFALACFFRLLLYIPWLVWAIIKANIQVASLVLNPRMPINPALLQFKTEMRKKISLVTLANSITLTPGTITVDLSDNTYVVHAIVPEAAGDLESGLMQNKIGHVFGEIKESAPSAHWAHSLEELR